ncbi:MAG: hypothetical protein U5K76_12445 [Woeseiaceae bacterium]|nr:hypothetical protein [Woeseiaceae bacterium]
MKRSHIAICLISLCSAPLGFSQALPNQANATNAPDVASVSEGTNKANDSERVNMLRFKHHIRTKRGGDDPSQIPLPNQMRMFMPMLNGMIERSENHREEISNLVGLSYTDTDILIEAASRYVEFSESTKEFTKQVLINLCEEHLDNTSGAVDSIGVGLALNKMRSQIRKRETTQYETLFSALSEEGELNLRRYLSENIASRMNSAEIDFAGMFAEDPTAFQQTILQRICSFSEPEPRDAGQSND